jgi:anti-sigma factor RsiW
MTCRELVEFLADYLDGDLPAEVRRVFETHLADCPECATYLRGYADAIRLARACAETDDAVPAGVPERLVRAILAARRRA